MKVKECVFYQLATASRAGTQYWSQQLQEYGLTGVQGMVMNFLGEEDDIPFNRLGDKLHLTSATLTGIIDRLEKIDLVERRPNSEDRRSLLVGLTAKGRELIPSLSRRMEDANRTFLNRMNREEESMLRGLLSRLTE